MADRVFNFGDLRVKEPSGEINKVEYMDYEGMNSPEHPILLLEGIPGAVSKGDSVKGIFSSPSIGHYFMLLVDVKSPVRILEEDKRFRDFLDFLGENHIESELKISIISGNTAVTDIVPSGGDGPLRDREGFFSLIKKRIYESNTFDEEAEEEDLREGLRDINEMFDFLSCAGRTLPPEIRRWAGRQTNIIRSSSVSPEERRHAERALMMVLNIRWQDSYFPPIDPVAAKKILDEELFGLDKVKQRIIETIIQINRTHTLPSYGILLSGPAGIGKSRLSYAIAKILGLPYAALDMSSVHDNEALTGSSRIYSNAKPGRIMEAFSENSSSKLVFIINELDKAEGASADSWLTLLDNLGYMDNYIELRIPTLGVYPVATANDLDKISKPLMSRFAVIEIPDYTEEEKKRIFLEFSLPSIRKRLGILENECTVTDDGAEELIRLIRGTTGCRELERAAEHLLANALYRIEAEGKKEVVFDRDLVRKVLE